MVFEDMGVHKSVEEDDDAWAEVQRMVARNLIKEFSSEADLTDYLGESPVYSIFCMIVKQKGNTVKKRLILDAKVSGVSGAASKLERVLLPRLLDVATNILHLQAEGPDVELFILDFANAFWLLPLSTARLRGKFFGSSRF